MAMLRHETRVSSGAYWQLGILAVIVVVLLYLLFW